MIHGHDVLNHILAHPTALSVEELKAWAASTHGTQATYHTCSAEGMTFDQLLSFLSGRQKISIRDGQVQAYAERMCQHGGEHGHDHHDHEHAHDHEHRPGRPD